MSKSYDHYIAIDSAIRIFGRLSSNLGLSIPRVAKIMYISVFSGPLLVSS